MPPRDPYIRVRTFGFALPPFPCLPCLAAPRLLLCARANTLGFLPTHGFLYDHRHGSKMRACGWAQEHTTFRQHHTPKRSSTHAHTHTHTHTCRSAQAAGKRVPADWAWARVWFVFVRAQAQGARFCDLGRPLLARHKQWPAEHRGTACYQRPAWRALTDHCRDAEGAMCGRTLARAPFDHGIGKGNLRVVSASAAAGAVPARHSARASWFRCTWIHFAGRSSPVTELHP